MKNALTDWCTRHIAIWCTTLLTVATAGGAAAQIVEARRYAIMSLVGDRFTVVERGEVTGSRLDRNPQTEIPLKSDIFDRAALGVVADLMRKSDPRANPTSLLIDEPALYAQQLRLFDNRFVRLPTSIVKASRDGGATHMLLITKRREQAAFKMIDAVVGQGTLSGLGFYVEPQMRVGDIDTRQVGTGFLGVYAVYRLTIIDLATEAIVADRPVTFTNVYTNAAHGAKGGHPWQALDAKEKITVIADMLMQSLRQELPSLLVQK